MLLFAASESGSKLAALQTLREYDGALVIAKRLKCGELALAFCFASGPPEVRKGKIDSESEFEGMNAQTSLIYYVRKMSNLQGPSGSSALPMGGSWKGTAQRPMPTVRGWMVRILDFSELNTRGAGFIPQERAREARRR